MGRRDRACAAVIRDDRILMVHVDHGTHRHWSLPGGGIEPGETREESVLRELREEAGLVGHDPRFLYQRPWGREQAGDIEFCYLVSVSPDQEPVLGHDPELDGKRQQVTAVAWRPLNELRDDKQVSLVLAALQHAQP